MADSSSHLEKMGRELKCPICLSLFRSAVSLTCNHVFCNLCIEKSMKSDSSCPVCKVPYRRREVRPAPHMDNLVSIYKSMEIASGVDMFVTQPLSSTKASDQGNQRQESDHCQEISKANRKSRGKQQKKSRKKSSDPVKPSFPTKKRVQVPKDPSSETPVRERIEEGLRQSTEAQQVEPSVEKHAAQRRDSVFTPFFWLRDEEDVEKLSQQTDADQTMGTPPNAPCFSDLMDSDDDKPADEGTHVTARDADCIDSEMFEWTQIPCSPELWSSPVKQQVPDSEEAKETNVEVCKEVNATGLSSPRAEISVDKDKKSNKRCRKSSKRVKKKEALKSVGDFPVVHLGCEEVAGRIISQKKSEGNITMRSCSKRTSEKNNVKKPKIVAQTGTTGEHRADNSEVNTKCLSSPRADISVDGNKSSTKRGKKSSQRVKKKGSISSVGDFPTVPPSSEEVAGKIMTQGTTEGNTTLGRCSKRTSESINIQKRKLDAQTGTATGEHGADNPEVNTNGLSSPRADILVDGNKKSTKRGRKPSQTVKKKESISSVGDIPVVHPCSEEVTGRIITLEKSEGKSTLRSCSKRTHENIKKVRFDKSSVQSNSKSDHELKSRKRQKVVTEGASMHNKAAKCKDGNDKDSDKSNSEVRDAQFFVDINIAPPAVNDSVLQKCKTIPRKFKCAFCHSTEDSEATGAMVHYVNGKPVAADYDGGLRVIHAHRNCTEWAPNVYFEEDNAVNLEAELARSKRIKCCCCDVKGAALGCYEKSCRKSFHVPCAKMIQQCRWDNDNFVMLCPLHACSKLPNEIVGSQKKKQKSILKRSVQTQHSEAAAKPTSNTTPQWSHPGTFRKVVLCCSALTNEEKEIVYKFERLSGVTEVKKWDSSVSHVIASTDQNGACRRTIKFMMGILEGKWILNIEWIKACINAMELVDEQLYEIQVDIHGIRNGPQLGRLRVLNKQPKLFDGCSFFFSGDFIPSYKGYLHDLVTAAGGRVLQRKPIPKDQDIVPSGNEKPTSFIIYSVELPDKCDPNKRSVIINQRLLDAEALAICSGSLVVSNSWVLNSIAGCTMQKLGEH